MYPLISVIVPMYNVEGFVEKSLQSIVNQSYKNLQIVVINDGSTDRSEEICRKIADKDSRVIIIQQENQGLSAARNTGIDHAKGEYFVFVDSDDCLAVNMIDFLFSEIKKYKVKLAMCSYKKVKTQDFNFEVEIKETEIISKNNAIERMLLGEWWSACMKMYEKSIFQNLRFPHGKTIEDYAILVQIMEQCEQISYSPSPLYFYLTREDSITTKPLNDKNFDEIFIMKKVLQYVEHHHPQFFFQAQRNLGASLIKLILSVYADQSKQFHHKLLELKRILSQEKDHLLKNPYLPAKQKFFVWFLSRHNDFFNRNFSKSYIWYKKNL